MNPPASYQQLRMVSVDDAGKERVEFGARSVSTPDDRQYVIDLWTKMYDDHQCLVPDSTLVCTIEERTVTQQFTDWETADV